MSEMKENRFRRIAGARVNKIINMLKLLGNCSHTGNYSYTKQQVEEIFGRLRSEVDEAYKRYQMCMKNAHLFSLSENLSLRIHRHRYCCRTEVCLQPKLSMMIISRPLMSSYFPKTKKKRSVLWNSIRNEKGVGNCVSAFIAVTTMKQLIMSRITTERNYNERYSGV